MFRTALAFVSLAVCAVLLAPAFTGRDNFPISSQPMYAVPRPLVERLVSARGIDPSGDIRELSMAVIADTDDPLIALGRMRDLAASSTSDRLRGCEAIARRAAGEVAGLVEIEVVSIDVDVIATASGENGLIREETVVRCVVR